MMYRVERADQPPRLDGAWDDASWRHATVGEVTHFQTRSSDHQPVARFRVLHDGQDLHVMFQVEDRYVICVHDEHQGAVCRDSCVEFFFVPAGQQGYFNIEVNCGGWTLFRYQKQQGVRGAEASDAMIQAMQIHHSLPQRVDPEMDGPVTWTVAYRVPLSVLSEMADQPIDLKTPWTANFYKCADGSSHPHWGSWTDLRGEQSFHCPPLFAPLTFA